MQYNDLCGNQVSRLGMGIMRLPASGPMGSVINEEEAIKVMDAAHEAGVNYFDTAYFYHGGTAEAFATKCLKRYPEDSYFFATKIPWSEADGTPAIPQQVFENQLEICQRDFFDYYLLQNVHDSSIDIYMDEERGFVSYLLEQKRKGKIRHLGFSAHCSPENLERWLNYVGDEMEFCQLEINYMDWVLQKAEKKYNLITEAGLPVVVMEPLRGGRLADIQEDEAREKLAALAPDMTPAEVSFRWLKELDNVRVVLSGMGSVEVVEENAKTFSDDKGLPAEVKAGLDDVVKGLVTLTPCTECKYCMRVCPQGIAIPAMIRLRDDCKFRASLIAAMGLDAYPPEQRADHCIQCGTCLPACPQSLDIPTLMAEMAELMKLLPDPNKH